MKYFSLYKAGSILLIAFLLQACATPMDMGSARLAYDSGDYIAASNHYREQAALGNTEAEFMLGEVYAKGQGIPQNQSEAMKWYKSAADKNHLQAQVELANAYLKNENYAEARNYFERAANSNNATAQFNLGYFYQNALG
ncbi:MAG: sel1 repeat family protein, partial [Kordiimonadaceae bacterium]|nr:sel1 repeat family protein [Kordiimonadaceae bacterium]